MDERIASILQGIAPAELAKVASGALDIDVNVTGDLTYDEITTPHAEDRTIGIVRVSGSAGTRRWSSVVKLVDLAVPATARVAGMTWPENEELVYERRLFADEGMSFRPARCYAVTRPTEQLKLFWLEDLSQAQGPPFSPGQLAQMARHLGEWNAHHAGVPPELGVPIGRDAYERRTLGWNFPKWFGELDRHCDAPFVRAAFRDGSSEAPRRLLVALDRLIERVKSQPHGLAFGDIAAGNVFFRPDETVAIDWASLTDDPIGVDGGCLVGSALSWGPDFMTMVRAERDMFAAYREGLRSGGWRGDDTDVRRAGLAQSGSYLITMAIAPVLLITGDDWLRGFLERRFGLPQEEICARMSELVALLPQFADEIEDLLA